MTSHEIKEFRSKIDNLIEKRRLGDAFETLRNAVKAISSWSVTDRIEKAEQSYGFMLRYLIDGVDDPSRRALYADLLREIATIRDILIREMSITDTPTLYYNTLRSVNSHRNESLDALFENHRSAIGDLSPFNNAATGASPSASDKLRIEMNERDIFNRLWTVFPLNIDDARLTAEFMADESLPYRTRSLCVSALTLGLLEFFDDRKLRVLLDAYRSAEPHISVRALVGIALALDKYSSSVLSHDTADALATIKEQSEWHTDIRRIFVELIRTTDTRRISAKLNEEIFPEIKRMGKNMAERMSELNIDSDTAGEFNPEWEDLLSDTKIRDNLKELGELQQEGADIFMTTFSSLKQFPFFNETANWFLPFDPEHSSVSSSDSGYKSSLSAMISAAPYVCDSDKYSMALSMNMMPESQKSMMASQLDAHSAEIADMLASAGEGTRPVDRAAEINNYVHSLYRFYHLFRRKGDFYNPFSHVANPVDIPVLESDFNNEEALLSLGEFYFKVGLYDYAQRIFLRLDDISGPEAARYQKLGFSCEKLGDFETAASYYEQADLLDGSNIWNLKRLSAVYRRLGQYSSAISVSRRIERLEPDNADIAVSLGYLFILDKDYTSAIECLHKAEFLSPDSLKPVRPLAWALMLNHNYDEAQNYYDRIIAADPTPSDLLNAGHLAWARQRLGEAINYYRLSAERTSVDTLIEAIRNDAAQLEQSGVSLEEMPLMIDAIIYSLK